MPSHYGGGGMKMKPAPPGTHRMPNGKLMTGDRHTKDSKPITEAAAKRLAKKKEQEPLDFSDIEQGGLRRALKLKKDEKFKRPELVKANKTETGKMFMFRGKEYKMSPLMKKRITLAINFLGMKK